MGFFFALSLISRYASNTVCKVCTAFFISMRVALVHDYLTELGGAERVLQSLCELYPHAPIYTLLYDEQATAGAFRGRRVHTSFLQNFPLSASELLLMRLCRKP